jgi:hypothetical protein
MKIFRFVYFNLGLIPAILSGDFFCSEDLEFLSTEYPNFGMHENILSRL